MYDFHLIFLWQFKVVATSLTLPRNAFSRLAILIICLLCIRILVTNLSVCTSRWQKGHGEVEVCTVSNDGISQALSNCSVPFKSKTFDLPQCPSALHREHLHFLKVEGRAESRPDDQFWHIGDWALACGVWRRHVVNHLALLVDPLDRERERRRGSTDSKDSLYSHLLINGGHHCHLTRLIDLHSLQGLCCVSISYWLFQVCSYWLLSLPPNHCSPLSAPLGTFFKQSFEIIIRVSKCHNRP